MKITQGAFSFLPELTDEEITKQVEYCINNRWALAIEFTDDPHPRNPLWEMWDLPMFDANDASAVVFEMNKCREAYPNHYIKVIAYDPSPGRATTGLDFIVNRPSSEPGFRLDRQEANDRHINYTLHSYAVEKPHGERYQENGSK